MPRALLLLCLLGGIADCAGPSPTYTIEAATVADANERAQRYCYLQDAEARLERTEQRGGKSISVYRCVPGSPRAVPLQSAT